MPEYNTNVTENQIIAASVAGTGMLAGGEDQGDGTASVKVTLVPPQSITIGNVQIDQVTPDANHVRAVVANTALQTKQTTLAALAIAVKISTTTPTAFRTLIKVTNAGANPIHVGPAGVSASTGFPIAAGVTIDIPLGPAVDLFGYSTAGSAVAVLEVG